MLTGAGSSAYAATAIAAAWPGARAIATTDLLLDARPGGVPELPAGGLLISIARSGDSPESVGVVELIQRVRPDVRHLALDVQRARAAGGNEGRQHDPAGSSDQRSQSGCHEWLSQISCSPGSRYATAISWNRP